MTPGRATPQLADEAPVGPAEFAAALAGLADAPAGPILLAVSGGPDSTALMHAAARWARQGSGPGLLVATVDHGSRPGSRAEAEALAAAAATLGLDHRILTWRGARGGPMSQERARQARYRLLDDAARAASADRIATAHTLDDQAETLMIRMAAGSGPAGLAGMASVTRRDGLAHYRPFLRIPKARLVATCLAEGWAFAADPSNDDPRFARARWRRLMPALAAEGLDAARLARLAERSRRADEALAQLAGVALARCRGQAHDGAVAFRALAAEPPEIVLRAIAFAVESEPADMRLDRLERCVAALLGACRDGTPMRRTLAGRLLALDRAGTLTITPEPARSRGRPKALTLPAARTPHSLGREGTRA